MGKKAIKVLSWNARSMSSNSKLFELQHLADREEIDIICVQETHLNPDKKIYINDFKLYRNDRNSFGGGVAIAVRNNFKSKTHRISSPNNIENIAVAVETCRGQLIFVSAYNPKYTSSFGNNIVELTDQADEYFIFGDFNAKHVDWNCHVNNQAGQTLHRLHNQMNFLIVHPMNYTHIPHSGGNSSCIDILLTNSSLQINDMYTHRDTLSSDHLPVICEIQCESQPPDDCFFDYRWAHWQTFNRAVGRDILRFSPTEDIDANLNYLINSIRRARDTSVPRVRKTSQQFTIAKDTENAIKFKNQLTRRFQRCNNDRERKILRSSINIIQRLVKELVARDNNRKWSHFLENIDESRFWKLTRSMRGKRETIPQRLTYQNKSLSNISDVANAFASNFAKSHEITSHFQHPHYQTVNASIASLRHVNASLDDADRIKTDEIIEIVASLRPFKSPGEDGIQNILIKNLPHVAFELLGRLFNSCLRSGYWPTQ